MSDRTHDSPADRPAEQPGRRPAAIDMHKLADKVYRLMQAEIRLEQARGSGAARKRGL
jgi:hypothetical protein